MKNLIKNSPYWGHIKENTLKDIEIETLLEHTLKTEEVLHRYMSEKNMDKIIRKTIDNCLKNTQVNNEIKKLIYQWLNHAIIFHDLGKINPNFQKSKLKNQNFKGANLYEGNSNHSLHSSYIYLDYFLSETKKLKEEDEEAFALVSFFVTSFSYVISRHHSFLNNNTGFSKKIRNNEINFYQAINKDTYDELYYIEQYINLSEFQEVFKIHHQSFYVLNKLLYSLLVECDFIGTHEFMTNQSFINKEIMNKDTFIHKYEETFLFKKKLEFMNNPNLYKENDINKLRTEMCIDAETEIKKNFKSNIFYLEQPAGSGKTNNSINLAIKLMKHCPDIKNIRYIFPLNTLSDQTYDTMKGIWGEEQVTVINSATQIKEYNHKNEEIKNKQSKDIDNKLTYLNKQMMNYPFYITSHVKLFDILFGTSRNNALMLSSLANSVVIIDEIQLYKNSIWKHFMSILEVFAENLNIKFIIMSATLPKINKILETDVSYVELIKDTKKYFQHSLFKDRVTLDFSLFDNRKDLTLSELVDKILDYPDKKVLVECLTKKRCKELYKEIKKRTKNKDNLYILDGDDTPDYRRKTIARTKETTPMILVATQIIEVGVDIDMDIGFLNSTTIESVEQFCARINRSALSEGLVYIFELDKVEKIYVGDIRTRITLKDLKIREYFFNKDFDKIYEEILKATEYETTLIGDNNFNDFELKCCGLHFKDIEEYLELIDTKNQYQIFVERTIALKDKNDKDITLNGKEIWEKYNEILKNDTLEYCEKKIKLNNISILLNNFTYNIYEKLANRLPYEFINGYYYVPDGEQFFEDDRFSREIFEEGSCGIFI